MLWNAVRHCLLSRLRPDLGASVFFFFNDTATTEIYTLSLHDALPISARAPMGGRLDGGVLRLSPRERADPAAALPRPGEDRKSTRLNSSHQIISYAVFCLQKKNRILKGILAKRIPVGCDRSCPRTCLH